MVFLLVLLVADASSADLCSQPGGTDSTMRADPRTDDVVLPADDTHALKIIVDVLRVRPALWNGLCAANAATSSACVATAPEQNQDDAADAKRRKFEQHDDRIALVST